MSNYPTGTARNMTALKSLVGLVLATAMIAFTVGMPSSACAEDSNRPPNFVIIFADDLGYGDLGCYGHPTIRTPALDRMAAEGMRFSQFYAAACVCTPSRAALLTGRLPIRNGMCSSRRRVLFPNSQGGIPEEELLLSEALKTKGYLTCCVGKWHLGHLPPYLPTRHGFDQYFGLPYSNDMRPLPLMRDTETLQMSPDQSKLTVRYTDEAVRFIKQCNQGENRDKPFFLYLPHTMPHVPLFTAPPFAGKSPRGLYGDVVETIDYSVGAILSTLRDEGLAENTLVVFTSDNGPWLIKNQNGGSAGLLRGGKGSTWDGGMREPAIFWWPGRIKPHRVTHELGSTLDLMATCLSLAGIELPADRELDSYDLSPVLLEGAASPRKEMFFYRGTELFAVRKGPWKMHLKTRNGYGQRQAEEHDPPLLFHLDHDPSEQYDLAKENSSVIEELKSLVEQHLASVKPVKNQLE